MTQGVGRVAQATPTEPTLRPVTPVGLLVERLDRIAALVAQGGPEGDAGGVTEGGAGGSLRTLVDQARELAGGLDPYLAVSTSPESPDLADLARRTLDYAFPEGPQEPGALEAEMLSGHVEGQFLQVLVRTTRARQVLEIGMFTGYSALAMAEALPDGGALVACEIDPEIAAFAESRFAECPAGRRITVEVGPALRTLDRLAATGATYDLVFIDADKPAYSAYLGAILDRDLLAPHGLICVDNTLLQGQAYGAGPDSDNGRAIAAFNAEVAADPRVQQVLVPLRDGITLICRAPSTQETPS